MKKKSSSLFQTAFKELQSALLERESRTAASAESTSATATLEAQQASASDNPEIGALLELNSGISEGLGRLQDQSRSIGNEMRQAYAELNVEEDAQERLSHLLLQSLRAFQKELVELQDANFRLESLLHEKRLLLDTRKKKLDEAGQRELDLRDTIAKLRGEHARRSQEARDAQEQLNKQTTDLERLKQKHLALQREHDELAGKFHRLFQEYNREKRKTQ